MQAVCKSALCAVTPLVAMLFLGGGCDPHDHDHEHEHEHDENEVISRVSLTFTPSDGGASQTFQFDDPDGDGGMSGQFERVELSAGLSYEMTLEFENALIDPPEDITAEIEDEAEDHFVFIYGDVVGPGAASTTPLVSHSYADVESDYGDNATGEDLPVGLVNQIEALSAGEGSLRVQLRHLTPLNGAPRKTGDLPSDLAEGRDLPGSVDVDLTFELVIS